MCLTVIEQATSEIKSILGQGYIDAIGLWEAGNKKAGSRLTGTRRNWGKIGDIALIFCNYRIAHRVSTTN